MRGLGQAGCPLLSYSEFDPIGDTERRPLPHLPLQPWHGYSEFDPIGDTESPDSKS